MLTSFWLWLGLQAIVYILTRGFGHFASLVPLEAAALGHLVFYYRYGDVTHLAFTCFYSACAAFYGSVMLQLYVEVPLFFQAVVLALVSGAAKVAFPLVVGDREASPLLVKRAVLLFTLQLTFVGLLFAYVSTAAPVTRDSKIQLVLRQVGNLTAELDILKQHVDERFDEVLHVLRQR